MPSERVAVFAKGADCKRLPSESIERPDAQYMVDCGVARWVNFRYNSIIMLVEAADFAVRGVSCQMGPRVIEGNAAGEGFFQAIVAAWAPAARAA